jgi:protein-tyrosine phosphatase
VIDLHSHILPGLDDGSPDLDYSIEMALKARAAGIQTIVATPHVNNTYAVDSEAMYSAVGTLNVALARKEVPLAVLPGAEIAIERLAELPDGELRRLTLGSGSCLLIETPYTGEVPFLEQVLFDLQVRGFRVLLGHPERSLAFRNKPDRLEPIVERGIATAINAGSLSGQFGTNARRVAFELVRRRLAHVIASDSHDTERRPPDLRNGIEALDEELPGFSEHADFFTRDAPAAILNGSKVPEPPEAPAEPQSPGWRRLLSSRARK